MKQFLDDDTGWGQFPEDLIQEITSLLLETYSDIEYCEYFDIASRVDVQFKSENRRRQAYVITVESAPIEFEMPKWPNKDEILNAPIGTILRSGSGVIYVKHADTYWTGVEPTSREVDAEYQEIRSVPGFVLADLLPDDSLEMLQ